MPPVEFSPGFVKELQNHRLVLLRLENCSFASVLLSQTLHTVAVIEPALTEHLCQRMNTLGADESCISFSVFYRVKR